MFDWLSKKLNINKLNAKIYFWGLVLSVAIVVPYLFWQYPIWTILCSIGASGVGAVLLGFFIERANNQNEKKRIDLFRNNKLNMIMFQATHTLERTGYWYYRIIQEVIKKDKSNKCFCISYDVLWSKFEEIENDWAKTYFSDSYSYETLKNMNNCVKSICAKYNSLSEMLSVLIQNIDSYEANGFFSHKEVSSLKGAMFCASGLFFDESNFEFSNMKNVFEALTSVKEFSTLKNAKIYYCNKKTAIIIDDNIFYNNGITQDIMESAI